MAPIPAHTTPGVARSAAAWDRRTTGIEGLLHALDNDARARVFALTRSTRSVAKGETLYVAGAIVEALFAVQSGSIKTSIGLRDGRRQLVGFHIAGDIVGLAGLATGRHEEDAVAAEHAEVAFLPYRELASLARAEPQLHTNLTRLLGLTSLRARPTVLGLAVDSAMARLAGFLLVLGGRFARRGHGEVDYPLPLTNQEIGSLLGLTSETVSRTFTALTREGLVRREGRRVELLDAVRLQRVAAQALPTGGREPPGNPPG